VKQQGQKIRKGRRHLPDLLIFLLTLSALSACGSRTGLVIPTDGGAFPSGPDECPNSGSTFVYVISEQNELLSFYPPTASFTSIGVLTCPVADPSDSPFSMAVDRRGVAYVLFSSVTLFRVSTRTGACETTPFVPGAGGFPTAFGMGYASDPTGNGETLYVAGNPMDPANPNNPLPSILGSLDTTAFAVTPIATFSPPTLQPELTGTGAGKLYGFYATTMVDSAIAEIDVTTAQLISTVGLPGVTQGVAWAFGFWGGDFYTFTAPGGPMSSSVVTRYRPADGSITQVATAPGTIVGAGVSTCAPQM